MTSQNSKPSKSKLKPPPVMVDIIIKVPAALRDAIDEIAVECETTRSKTVREFLKRGVKEWKEENH